MPSTFISRKLAELQTKLDSLDQDFSYWRSLTKDMESPDCMALHTSQIMRLVGENTGILERLRASLAQFFVDLQQAAADEILTEARNFENGILMTHSIWGFFREKLAQRLDSRNHPFLNAADELAWACYLPAREAAGSSSEHPLVYLSGSISPFIQPRNSRMVVTDVNEVWRTDPEYEKVLNHLPLPVISLPHSQVSHLPEAIFVAHETGHAVEDDFHLTDELQAALKLKIGGGSNKKEWAGWMGEIFADVWAVAHTGPAYVSALQDFLASDTSGHGEGNDLYPPVAVRLRLAREALREIGCPDEATRLKAAMKDTGLSDKASVFDAEIPVVVDALLNTKLKGMGGKSAADLKGYSHEKALAAKKQALGNEEIGKEKPQILFAALRLAYDEAPEKFLPGVNNLTDGFLQRLQPSKVTTRKLLSTGADMSLFDALPVFKKLRKIGNAD